MAPKSPRSLSFRDLLTGVVSDFLRDEEMACLETTEGLVELVVALADYRQEGTALYPEIYFCDDLRQMLSLVGASDSFQIGSGPRSAATLRRGLKRCAPLAQGGWCIYVVRSNHEFTYGVFCGSNQ